ncbi:hypothetical protein Acsp05_12450 [Actinokineospora sp. NBRC 105648]|nr:hypothetical protein Acsp05_12450 [Actinokineospora sp. NBRC 105648]
MSALVAGAGRAETGKGRLYVRVLGWDGWLSGVPWSLSRALVGLIGSRANVSSWVLVQVL